VAVSPAPKKSAAKKRPRATAAPAKPREGELGGRLRSIVETAIGAMEGKMRDLVTPPAGAVAEWSPDPEKLAQVMAIGEKAVVWMGHVRRSDEAARKAAGKVSRTAAIEWARGLTEDEREQFIGEIGGEEPSRSVFE
jgi:hypothetical protein